MTKIKRSAQGNPELEAELKDGFRLLMGWRSQETIDIYTHVLNKRKALLDIVLHDQEHEEKQQSVQITSSPLPQTEPHSASLELRKQTPHVPEDEVSWYEEE